MYIILSITQYEVSTEVMEEAQLQTQCEYRSSCIGRLYRNPPRLISACTSSTVGIRSPHARATIDKTDSDMHVYLLAFPGVVYDCNGRHS
jgi:hypothetical protein